MSSSGCDSYCGIYCGACDIRLTYETGKTRKLALFWNESTVKSFQNKLGLKYDTNKPFTYKCNGCKSDSLFVNCAVCKIRECAINSHVNHCIDCEKYPCNLIIDSRKIGSLLPHIKGNRSNMERIRNVGVDHWLSEQEKRWKCPECGTGFSWYTNSCTQCGKDLKQYSFRFSIINSLIMKLVIQMLRAEHKQS
jgi:hypothetical protein